MYYVCSDEFVKYSILILLYFYEHALSVFLDTCTIMHKVLVFKCADNRLFCYNCIHDSLALLFTSTFEADSKFKLCVAANGVSVFPIHYCIYVTLNPF